MKLSEIKDDEMLLVDDTVIQKADLLKELEDYKDAEIYTTTEYKANVNAKDMLNSALEYEYDNMYEDWEYEIEKDITDKDIEDLQAIVDRILNRSNNISYIADKKVEIDVK